MARTVRAVSAPRATAVQIGTGHTVRMQSGSMGAPTAPVMTDEPLGTPDRFEAPNVEDARWQDEIRRREMAAGLPTIRRTNGGQPLAPEFTPAPYSPTAIAAVPIAPIDLTDLPDRFTLEVQRKGDGWWIIRSPQSHIGLFVAHQDLVSALSDAPRALAQILRLDGPVPEPRKRKPKGAPHA